MNRKLSTPHSSELPGYTEYEMDIMRQKGERVSKLTRTYMKELGIKPLTK